MKFEKLLLLSLLSFCSCKKHDVANHVLPTANFEITNLSLTNNTYVGPTFISLATKNSSNSAKNYLWNTSNGISSKDAAPQFQFSKSGNYKITLKVNSVTGDTSAITKNITVVDRHLYNVKIINPNWSNGKQVSLFVRIYNPGTNNTIPTLIGDQYNATTYYQSSTLAAAYSSSAPLSIDIPNNIVLIPKKELLVNVDPGLFVNYGYCIYSVENGVEHLLASSWDGNTSSISNDILSLGISSLEISNLGLTGTFFAYNNR